MDPLQTYEDIDPVLKEEWEDIHFRRARRGDYDTMEAQGGDWGGYRLNTAPPPASKIYFRKMIEAWKNGDHALVIKALKTMFEDEAVEKYDYTQKKKLIFELEKS